MTGGVCYPRNLSIRYVASTWCLAALILTSIYSTTLISYVASPNWKPLVHSIYDIPMKPGVDIVVDEKNFVDAYLSVSGLFQRKPIAINCVFYRMQKAAYIKNSEAS